MDSYLRSYLLLAILVPGVLAFLVAQSDESPFFEFQPLEIVWYLLLVPLYLLLYIFLFGEGYGLLAKNPDKAEIPKLRYIMSRIGLFGMAVDIILMYAVSLKIIGFEHYKNLFYLIPLCFAILLYGALRMNKATITDHLQSTRLAAVIFVSMIAIIPSACVQYHEDEVIDINISDEQFVLVVDAPMVEWRVFYYAIDDVELRSNVEFRHSTFGYENDTIRSGTWSLDFDPYVTVSKVATYKDVELYITLIYEGEIYVLNMSTEDDTRALYNTIVSKRTGYGIARYRFLPSAAITSPWRYSTRRLGTR